jgi:hypothetical protein
MVLLQNFHEETEFTTEAGRNGVVNLTKQFQKWIRFFLDTAGSGTGGSITVSFVASRLVQTEDQQPEDSFRGAHASSRRNVDYDL